VLIGVRKSHSLPAESLDEARARRVVEGQLSADQGGYVQLEFWDDGSSPEQRHDYWITIAGERWGALEVTTLADQQVETGLATWDKYGPRPGGRVPGLSGSWEVTLAATVKPRELMPRLPGWLADLERRGVTELRGRVGSEADPVAKELRAAGVDRVKRRRRGRKGQLSFMHAWIGPRRRADDDDPVVTTLESVMALSRHQADTAKLSRCGLAEQHLFFWISYSCGDLGFMLDGRVPDRTPQLAGNLTGIWLVPVVVPNGQTKAVYWSRSGGWRQFTMVV
jgi:hypothetical protein